MTRVRSRHLTWQLPLLLLMMVGLLFAGDLPRTNAAVNADSTTTQADEIGPLSTTVVPGPVAQTDTDRATVADTDETVVTTAQLTSHTRRTAVLCDKYLRRGSHGGCVGLLQVELNYEYARSRVRTRLAVDGIFGWKTHQALTRFQDKYGLEVDGVLGPETAHRMRTCARGCA